MPHVSFETCSDLVISILPLSTHKPLSRRARGKPAPTQLWNKHFFVLTTQGSVQTWRLCRARLHTQSPRTGERKREKETVTGPCLGSLRLQGVLPTPSTTRLTGKRTNQGHRNCIHRHLSPSLQRQLDLILAQEKSCLGSWRQCASLAAEADIYVATAGSWEGDLVGRTAPKT